MKLFNEIKADVGGTVSRVMADNGMLVKRQQPLFEVRLA
jgi:biotin carboxyl carrier protein